MVTPEVLLVVPPMKNFERTPAPSVGVLSMASALRRAGYGVSVLDMPTLNDPYGALESALQTIKPIVVGISAMDQDLAAAITVAQVCNEAYRPKVVLGGPGPAMQPSRLMEERVVDAVLRGEGEVALVDVVGCVASGKDLSSVPGLVWRNDDGLVCDNGKANLLAELDAIDPPAWDLANLEFYRESNSRLPLLSTRGCEAACRFCPSPAFWQYKVRRNSVQRWADDVERFVVDLSWSRLYLADDDFADNRVRTDGFLTKLLERDLGVRWACNARFDSLDEELLIRMRLAGCERITLGLESPSDARRRRIGKGAFSNERVEDVARQARAMGIDIQVNLMFGLPGETLEDVKDGIAYTAGLRPGIGVRQRPGTLRWYSSREISVARQRGRWRVVPS